jgi:uncharacterized membrane protein YgdD (TMEM256/DUF423 family)
MDRKILATAAFFGMTAVILGAFGAHTLKEHLNPSQLQAFETGVRYQIYHAFLLLFVGLAPMISAKKRTAVFWLTSVGIVFFSGSIYLLSTAGLTGIGTAVIGPVTPIGGLLLIVAWFMLFIDFATKKS